MAQMGRPGISAAQKSELWQRWKDGETLSEIGRMLEMYAGSVFGVLKANGVFIPRTRTRSSKAPSQAEREEISRGLVLDLSFRRIASHLNRSSSTVSREVTRNGGHMKYRASSADIRT